MGDPRPSRGFLKSPSILALQLYYLLNSCQTSLDEPKLSLSVFTGKSHKSLFMFALRLVFAMPGSQSSIESSKVRWVEITSEEQQYVQVDGDYFGSISATKPAKISVVPSAFHIKGYLFFINQPPKPLLNRFFSIYS
ncbi:MAG: hypothetical protein GXO85_12585 [Chlorobi bacterium]|nr:hypothetical protein [Chlorobiota bacterium]